MKSFEFRGKLYESAMDFCRKNNFSYSKFKYLKRRYRRAQGDLALVASWMFGAPIAQNEPRSRCYYTDQALATMRQIRYLSEKRIARRKAAINAVK